MFYQGLSSAEVQERVQKGLKNVDTTPATKTVRQIVLSHCLTLFNAVNLTLAILVIAVGSYRNLLFMGVVISNTLIGIFQEIRAKRIVDRLSLITQPHAQVIRDGREQTVAIQELVLDDWIFLKNGGQIVADAQILEGEIEVNEALITGEPDAILKRPGDCLLSGSFVTSGHCLAQVKHVGADNYAASITEKAKVLKEARSELMDSVNRIIRFVSILLIPVGVLLFCKQLFLLSEPVNRAIVGSVAAMVGMIPEGLVLLTSVSLAVGVIKLAKRKTLVQELYCIESLARVDVLCLDKTGTLTEGSMKVEKVVPLNDNVAKSVLESVLGELMAALKDDNATAQALREQFPCSPSWKAVSVVPFSSARKYSAVDFGSQGVFALGAPEFLFPQTSEEERAIISQYMQQGKRVLLLARADQMIEGGFSGLCSMALVVFSDKVRSDAQKTLAFFARQGVELKIISGDQHTTVASVAKEAGLKGAERSCDLTGLSDGQVTACCENYTVFGRVTPHQKLVLVQALKKKGHTVAMTGDGVNDVLALKDADCSIAMASGSEAARNVSQLVLLDSNFSSLPQVVMEGRRVINNTQRSASLYLVKTLYSTILAFIFLFATLPYPFVPIQMTLIGAVTVGIPSFFLALEPNGERVNKDFLYYVFRHSVPGAFTIILSVICYMAVSLFLPFSQGELSTLAATTTGFIGFLVLFRVCQPFHKLRALLFAGMFGIYITAITFWGSLFQYTPLSPRLLVVLFFVCLFSGLVMFLLSKGIEHSYPNIHRILSRMPFHKKEKCKPF